MHFLINRANEAAFSEHGEDQSIQVTVATSTVKLFVAQLVFRTENALLSL